MSPMAVCGGAVATFDYVAWIAQFPVFKNVPEAAAQAWFDTAGTLYLRNDGTGPCSTASIQLNLLNLLTAHLVALSGAASANGQPPPVGRINSATEGSVSVGTENLYAPGSAQWFQQTPWGAMYWQASSAYRTARFVRPSGHGLNGPLGSSGFPGGQVGGVPYPLGGFRRGWWR